MGSEQIEAALVHLARADYLVGHNITGYDLPLLRRLQGWAPSSGCTVVDTLVAGRLILPNVDDLDDQAAAMGDPALGRLRGRYSLEAWGARLGIPKVGTDIEDWSAWTPEMQTRCISDTEICKALYHFLQPDGYSHQAMELEHRAAAVCDQIVAAGAPFDVAAAERLHRQWTARRAELEAQLSEQFPDTNLNSRQQIAALLEARGWIPQKRTEKTKQPKIDDELLETIPEIYPEFNGLAEYLLLGRRLAALTEGKKAWCKHVGTDGRIHGGLVHIGTPHSRAKHLDPNVAQTPNPKKGKPFGSECRALFRPDNGWVLVAADQASLQDRGFAHYLYPYDGGAYAKAFLAGEDTHWKTAATLGLIAGNVARDKHDQVHTAIREGGKRFRYAFLFGAQALRAGQIIYGIARAVHQIDDENKLLRQFFGTTTRPQTNTLTHIGSGARKKFLDATPGLSRLLQQLERHAGEHGWLPGLDGRRVPVRSRHSVLNFIVTSSEAIICKRWLVRTYDELCSRFRYGWDGDAVIALWIHDELVCCCRPEIAEQVGEIMVRQAKEPGEHYSFKVPLDAEYTIGRNWAGEPLDNAQVIAKEVGPDISTNDDADIDEIDASLVREGIEPLHFGDRVASNSGSAWLVPNSVEVLPGSAEFTAILASLSEEDRAVVRPPETSQGNGHDRQSAEQQHDQHRGGQDRNSYDGYPHGERDNGQQVTFYIYRHADGRPNLGVKKTSTKQFPQFHWTGSSWAKGAPPGPKIPYRLPELIKAPLDEWVLICAGEKDAETAAALGFAATTNPEGERKGAWAPELNVWFAGRRRVAIRKTTTAPAARTRSRWRKRCAIS
jgi:DNA polymerase I-like protein with 3'-5' exonuclease and polymerase domains